jgi:hypothetical protein
MMLVRREGEYLIKAHGNEIFNNGHTRTDNKVIILLTPGYEGSPHRFPKDTIPSCTQCESISSINGPP